MNFKCPLDYKIEDCSSSEYGLTCDTCFHKDDNGFNVRAYHMSRHEVYEISKDLFNYTEISKEQVIKSLLRFRGIYAIPMKEQLRITNNINDSVCILRLLMPFKDTERDSYFVLVSSVSGYKNINGFHDYQELMYYLNKYRSNLG